MCYLAGRRGRKCVFPRREGRRKRRRKRRRKVVLGERW